MRHGETAGGSGRHQLLAFVIDGEQYAFRIDSVQRLARMVEIKPLPKAPEIVIGLIQVHGKPVPVLSLKRRFGLPDQTPRWNDLLIIARTSSRSISVIVDSVIGIIEREDSEITAGGQIVPGLEYVSGVTKLEDSILFIHDLDRFLSLDEETSLDLAIATNR